MEVFLARQPLVPCHPEAPLPTIGAICLHEAKAFPNVGSAGSWKAVRELGEGGSRQSLSCSLRWQGRCHIPRRGAQGALNSGLGGLIVASKRLWREERSNIFGNWQNATHATKGYDHFRHPLLGAICSGTVLNGDARASHGQASLCLGGHIYI